MMPKLIWGLPHGHYIDPASVGPRDAHGALYVLASEAHDREPVPVSGGLLRLAVGFVAGIGATLVGGWLL